VIDWDPSRYKLWEGFTNRNELSQQYGDHEAGVMRTISISKGCRSLRSVDCGLRPNASETSLPAPANFPLGDDQVSSGS